MLHGCTGAQTPELQYLNSTVQYLNLGEGCAWAWQEREKQEAAATVTALMVPLATASLGPELPIGSASGGTVPSSA